MARTEQTTRISVTVAARRAGVELDVVRHCVRVGLVNESLTEADVGELRRIRRLADLNVNMPGIEIILRMRRQIIALQAELEQFKSPKD